MSFELLFLLCVVCVVLMVKMNKMNLFEGEVDNIANDSVDCINKSKHYKKKNLLTKAEYSFWKVLYATCVEKELIICPKVRMEDFLSVVNTDKKEFMRYRGYIKSRHIDFLICDSALHIIAGIELDDNSHNNDKVKQVDEFKNRVFENTGLKLYRISMSEGRYQEQIEKVLAELCGEK